MKNPQPTWPQTALICACAAVFCFLGYMLSRLRNDWGTTAWIVLALMAVTGIGFLSSILCFYLRPQYGNRALAMFALLLLGHVILAAVLWRMGITK